MKDGGTIDIDDGKVKVRFMAELRKDLGLVYRPEHWTEAKLAAWICRNLPDPYTTHSSKNAFVSAWIGKQLMQEGYDPRIGDFDSTEEYPCACELEKWAGFGRS